MSGVVKRRGRGSDAKNNLSLPLNTEASAERSDHVFECFKGAQVNLGYGVIQRIIRLSDRHVNSEEQAYVPKAKRFLIPDRRDCTMGLGYYRHREDLTEKIVDSVAITLDIIDILLKICAQRSNHFD